jgi:hypothetical protein
MQGKLQKKENTDANKKYILRILREFASVGEFEVVPGKTNISLEENYGKFPQDEITANNIEWTPIGNKYTSSFKSHKIKYTAAQDILIIKPLFESRIISLMIAFLGYPCWQMASLFHILLV